MQEERIIWSVSLVPYHERFGYLVCHEERRHKNRRETSPTIQIDRRSMGARPPMEALNLLTPGETRLTSLQVHPIGGKVEVSDRDPLYAALREFIEETKIYQDLEPLLIHTHEATLSTKDVVVGQKVVSNDITLIKVHRFYVWDITHLQHETITSVIRLPFSYRCLSAEMKEKIESLQWIARDDLRKIPNRSILMDLFLRIV